MAIPSVPYSQDTKDELYPGLPAPHRNQPDSELSRILTNKLNLIPGYVATQFLDIYDAQNPKFTRQPDVTLMLEANGVPERTLHLDTYSRPEMVVEIVSDGRIKEDDLEKVEIYFGWEIPLYLILDSVQKLIRIIELEGKDTTYPLSEDRLKLGPHLEICWDGTPKGLRIWWNGKELLDNAENAQLVETYQNQILEKDQAYADLIAKLKRKGINPDDLQ